MKVRILGCAAQSPAVRQYVISYLINDRVAIDAGCLGFNGTPEEQAATGHVFLSHSHVDHSASLPVFLENATASRPSARWSTARRTLWTACKNVSSTMFCGLTSSSCQPTCSRSCGCNCSRPKSQCDLLEPYLSLPSIIVSGWLFVLLHQLVSPRPGIALGAAVILAVFILSVFCIGWVRWQASDEGERS